MIVHLGALGVVSKLTLDIIPHFYVRNYAYTDLHLKEIVENFDGKKLLADSLHKQSMFLQVFPTDMPTSTRLLIGR